MRVSDSDVLMKYFEETHTGNYDFYRCFNCGRLITRQQEREIFFRLESEPKLSVCRCGSMNYSPAWPVGPEWVLPRVVRYVYRLLLVRGLAVWADGRYPRIVKFVEWLVRNEWEKSVG